MANAQDTGSSLITFPSHDAAVITAGAGNDNTVVVGNVCDRLAIHAGQLCQSAKLVIAYKGVINTSETLAITASLTDCATSNGSFVALVGTRARHVSSAGVITAITLTAGAIGATTVALAGTLRGCVELDVPLVTARQYLQASITANLSRSGTDTVAISAVLVLGGSDVNPA